MTVLGSTLSVVAVVALCTLILGGGRPRFEKAPSWRGLALSMAVVNSLILVLVTEVLSALGRLEFGWLLAAWGLSGAAQLPWWRRRIGTLRRFRVPAPPLTGIEFALLVPVVIIVGSTAVTALASAPNSWDSLTYHLSRVAHWKQNGSVEFFPTSNERQLSFPPFAEYVILHLQLLTGGDYFAGMVQWLSFVGTLLGVSLIAAEFGASRRGQLVAVVFAATLPIAILEASSTQNDLVVSFWLVCFSCFSIGFVNRPTRFDAAAAAGALGLALLTKATAYLILPGFALGILVVTLRRHGLRPLPLMLGGVILAVGVPAAFYARNGEVFEEPVGSAKSRADHTTSTIEATPLISSLLRGAALHASAPPIRLRLPERVKAAVESVERRLSGRGSLRPLDAANWRYTMSREDRAGAPLHFLVLLVVLGALGIRALAWRVPGPVLWHALGCMVGVAVLTGYLKWNPYLVRFHMNLFLLAAPLVGLAVTRMRRPQVGLSAAAVLALASAYPLLWNQLRPLIGPDNVFHTSRRAEYFAGWFWNTEKRDHLLATIDVLKSRHDAVIGLQLGAESNEYPFWILLPEVAAGRARLCHVNVSNRSRGLQSREVCRPDAIATDQARDEVLIAGGVEYRLSLREGDYGIYLPASGSSEKAQRPSTRLEVVGFHSEDSTLGKIDREP